MKTRFVGHTKKHVFFNSLSPRSGSSIGFDWRPITSEGPSWPIMHEGPGPSCEGANPTPFECTTARIVISHCMRENKRARVGKCFTPIPPWTTNFDFYLSKNFLFLTPSYELRRHAFMASSWGLFDLQGFSLTCLLSVFCFWWIDYLKYNTLISINFFRVSIKQGGKQAFVSKKLYLFFKSFKNNTL